MMIATRRAILRTTALAAPAVALAACVGQTSTSVGTLIQTGINDAQAVLSGINGALSAFLSSAGSVVGANAQAVVTKIQGYVAQVQDWISAGSAAVVAGAEAVYTFATKHMSVASVTALLAQAVTLLSGLLPAAATPNAAPSPMAVHVAAARTALTKMQADQKK